MKRLFVLLFVFATFAFGQACPGGFWGNGQCIGPCESPLVNPNMSLAFYEYECSAQPPCENNYVYCYPAYTGYDNAYNQYCGVIIDWNDGGCTPTPPLSLDRFGPHLNRPITIPAGLLLKARYNVLLKQARPGAKCTYTKKFRKFRKEKSNVRLALGGPASY